MFHGNSSILIIGEIDISIAEGGSLSLIPANPNRNHSSHLAEQIKQLTLYHIDIEIPNIQRGISVLRTIQRCGWNRHRSRNRRHCFSEKETKNFFCFDFTVLLPV
ncbi:hypothetical protein V8G54_011310 [Vigna mungo]|uniref:Uncharacterized protein n=1 Tax=Vigna mungo TaxID=3915 RepID=A0AAQ3S2Y0_VIGMU